MEPVSATVITFNEEQNIEAALQSLSWADEIVVVDSGSTDETLNICSRYTDRIFHRDWTGYVAQKNFALERARHNWVLSLDADERVSPDLVREIAELRRDGLRHQGYRIPRLACFMGRWIRHGDWYPDYQLRLFDRRQGRWQGGRVHESVKIAQVPGILRGEIYHYTYRRLSDYLRRLEVYSTLAAADYLQRGRTSGPLKLLGNPCVTFLKTYFIKRGFLDGVPGLMVAIMGSVSVFFKYAKLYELQQESGPASAPKTASEPRA
jgi:glycosyltransferase involved in cell wall biosynthesis